MAPARSNKRTQHEHPVQLRNNQNDPSPSNDAPDTDLFLEPMMGTPLTVYIEKDVDDRDALVELITKHGGAVSPGYSGTPYILGKSISTLITFRATLIHPSFPVDPHKESGQNLYRQYAGKKGKVVLHHRWVHECVRLGALQTFQNNWAGCKVTGTETVNPPAIVPSQNDSRAGPSTQVPPIQQPIPPTITPIGPTDPLGHPPQGSYGYPLYGHAMHPSPRAMQPPTAAPPQSWQAPNAIAPQQTHMAPPQPLPGMLPRPAQPYRDGPWVTPFDHPPPTHMVGGPSGPAYDYRYRDDPPEWASAAPSDYPYDPATYEQHYEHAASFMPEADPSTGGPSTVQADNAAAEKPRGRKRTRNQGTPAAPPSTLVLNRRNPPARSPTPPNRVIKSTYGGNLFTSDDVLYLKRYIDYCQEQGLVLSLREICERIAVKAPHHTFYSWRRYCNKHQIRLGGYSMDLGDVGTPEEDGDQAPSEVEPQLSVGIGPGIIAAAQRRLQQEGNQPRSRSPTPPRALFRSTTGKGVAFTDEDAWIGRLNIYPYRSQDRFDMVAFWKDVATKAPHHSRASWMKFWRRHKHELNRTEGDDPLPQPPEKKMRYSRSDDILLAKYFLTKPEGTSDKIFQAFGRLHPHHPWKGWQEHHRIHKAKIDHLIQRLANGENIDIDEVDVDSTDV
ncbi:hypothetical protein BU15DRAFT_71233 [Melanogaster broomeanus]|nr:hypothetical protein BU15DRAFT_71233 [Melanogaster broomeanus]